MDEKRDDEVTIDLVELLQRLLHNWVLLLSLTLAGAAISAGITFFLITPLYQATSKIYVVSRKDSAINLSDLQLGTSLTQDYVELFKVWEVHEQVINGLDLKYTYDQLQKMLSVTNTTNTRIINITISSPSPQEAASIANEYAKVSSDYIAETMSTDRPNIVSTALVPTAPSSPKKLRNIAIGALLGLVLAVAIETIRMLSDDRIRTADYIKQHTGLVNLATIPDNGSQTRGAANATRGRKGRR